MALETPLGKDRLIMISKCLFEREAGQTSVCLGSIRLEGPQARQLMLERSQKVALAYADCDVEVGSNVRRQKPCEVTKVFDRHHDRVYSITN